MSADEIQSLLVRIEPEGVDETTESLQQQSEQFEETADVAEEESGRLQGFSERWSGAMTAIVAGLAIGAAGLASQVPVIGELMGGLVAIIDALAFQMDQVLRPVLQPLTNLMFGLSEAIFQLDGVAGAIVGVLTSIAAALGVVAGVAALFGSSLSSIIGFLAGLGPVIAGVSAGALALAAALGAIIGLIGVLILDVLGVLDFFRDLGALTREVAEDVIAFVSEGVSDAFDWLVSAVNDPLGAVEDILGVLEDIGSWITTAISDAFDWLVSALEDPLAIVEDILGTLEDIAGEVFTATVEIIKKLLGAGERPEREPFETGTVSPRFTEGGRDVLIQQFGNNETIDPSNIPIGGPGQNRPTVVMDGKEVSNQTDRYWLDSINLRGSGP